MKKIILSGLVCLIGLNVICEAQGTIEIAVSDVKNDKGKVIIMLFDDATAFADRSDPFKRVKVDAKKGTVSYTFEDLPLGTYALMVAHDENDNDKIDKNLIGFPKEPVGASNQTGFGKPSFKRSKFMLSEGQKEQSILIEFMN